MTRKPPMAEDSDEISVVIRALREADLRLEELTAGEVDTVSDRDGRSFLLQRAQNQLRDAEAAKQAAILNALPAYIAVLDAAGRVHERMIERTVNELSRKMRSSARTSFSRCAPRSRWHSIRAEQRADELFHGVCLWPANQAPLVPAKYHTVGD